MGRPIPTRSVIVRSLSAQVCSTGCCRACWRARPRAPRQACRGVGGADEAEAGGAAAQRASCRPPRQRANRGISWGVFFGTSLSFLLVASSRGVWRSGGGMSSEANPRQSHPRRHPRRSIVCNTSLRRRDDLFQPCGHAHLLQHRALGRLPRRVLQPSFAVYVYVSDDCSPNCSCAV